ncbi:3-deoxy-D-manno-octulosonic acid transferase [Primorskyibacter flagellatus]|uniref:3-deoxy-D-manno-octulosonic acid transferase n=1 Tax=Primorskyibacter flagellatus TaxID=1387277 RepID=UPI003A933B02
MARAPLSLAAYLALSRGRASEISSAPMPSRPAGALVWAHTEDASQLRALSDICQRLGQQRNGFVCLLTYCKGEPPRHDLAGVICLRLPPDTVADSAAFLTHWSPTACLWTGSELRPVLLRAAAERGCALALLDIQDKAFSTPALRWLPDTVISTLRLFDRHFAVNGNALRRLRRLGLGGNSIRVAGPLLETPLPLPCNDVDHSDAAAMLSGRPVWLAARVQANEVDIVLNAFRQIRRLAHRLLLVIVPEVGVDAGIILNKIEESALRHACWDIGEQPDEATEILLVVDIADLGLWYRLAPVSLVGSSLLTGQKGRNPFEAAALGSAVLHGPDVGSYLPSYSRLAKAGAARVVRDAETLAAAVAQLIAPDRAAQMAHAGWEVVSEGAELTNQVIAFLNEALDAAEED